MTASRHDRHVRNLYLRQLAADITELIDRDMIRLRVSPDGSVSVEGGDVLNLAEWTDEQRERGRR